MDRDILANSNLVAFSANLKEAEINTEQTLDTCFLVDVKTILGLEPRRENNVDEANGKEEPDVLYDRGNFSSAPLEFPKAQAQHFAFGYAFGLGLDTPSAWGTGYKHLITPITNIFNHPSTTGAIRYGANLFKRRLASLYVDQLKATFAKDAWAKLSLNFKGTGKFSTNMAKESVTAAYNAATFTLAANGVQGADAAARLASIHQVRVLVPSTGEYVDVVVTAVSNASPAVFTITAPGGVATSTTYEILYVPTEPAWCTFPARITEPPLQVTDLVVKLGGKWDGTSFLGGHSISQEIESVEHVLSNNQVIEFRPGGTGKYANYARRDGRIQTLNLNREARDYILQQRIEDNEYFGVSLEATGDEFETGKNYYIKAIFPKVGVLKSPISVNGKLLAEAGDLTILQDDTYGSVIVEVANMVSGYAQ